MCTGMQAKVAHEIPIISQELGGQCEFTSFYLKASYKHMSLGIC